MAQILVVEDNPMNMELTVDLLESCGYEVIGAEDGVKALELIERSNFNLVMLDMQLPKMDGLEVLARLKSKNETANIPVVALTAHAMDGDEKRFMDSGCAGYIAKPIDTHEFKIKVRNYLGE